MQVVFFSFVESASGNWLFRIMWCICCHEQNSTARSVQTMFCFRILPRSSLCYRFFCWTDCYLPSNLLVRSATCRESAQCSAPCRFFSGLSFSESPLVSSGFNQRYFELEVAESVQFRRKVARFSCITLFSRRTLPPSWIYVTDSAWEWGYANGIWWNVIFAIVYLESGAGIYEY